MPYLTLDSLSYQLPDSTPLFTGLTVALPAGLTGLVGANGTGKSTLLRIAAGRLEPSGGHLSHGGRVSLLRQRFEPEETLAALFGAESGLALLDRCLAGQASAEDLAEADWGVEADLEAALSRVGLDGVNPRTELGRLSGGQQRRAALAALFFDCPEIVLLDEPTNDLDQEGRQIVRDLLLAYRNRGLALVASHDRALLEEMDRILVLEAGEGKVHPGGWSYYAAARAADRARAEARLERADSAVAAAEVSIAASARKAAGRARQGRALRASGSQGKMLTDAMKDRAERGAAGAARLAERRRAESRAEQAAARAALPPQVPRRLHAAASERSHGSVLRFRDVSFRFGDKLSVLNDLSMEMFAGERIALVGPNGAGKSTLLRLAAGLLEPDAGQIQRARVAFLDQQAEALGRGGTLREVFEQSHPELGRNAIQAALARMGFRGEAAAAQVRGLSGGERVQAALALVLAGAKPPDLLLLDEPTNHLDIAALEAVEEGLLAYRGALLVVSHDAAFLERLRLTRQITLPFCG
ncbi:ABC-F family ATP-binding cassette domain-containing protein [Tropicimonas marinistellae]|uniref:ABC-F family ATP-binding cassette domain-containing protein n=1 Tax=Tropicimonas marinistellae TaxID=1739787 RepID=UPI00137376CF|nr:ATP-binding cassette domain-containing protein [Tropicimonas marinistellae]